MLSFKNNKNSLLASTSLLVALVFFVPLSAQAQSYNYGQGQGYQPYYVSETTQPAPVVTTQHYVQQQTSSSSSYDTDTHYDGTGRFFAPSGDRILSDPLYLPLRGQFYGSTDFNWNTGTMNTYNAPTGNQTQHASSFSDNLQQQLWYGVTDDVTLRVTESFSVSQTEADAINGHTNEQNSNGFTDPTFGVLWRAVDQRNRNPLDLDVSVSYAPNMIDASSGGSGHDGSEASGRQTLTLQTGIGREMRGISWAAYGGGVYNGKRTYTAQAVDNSLENGDFWSYYVGGSTQVRFSDVFSINGSVRYSSSDNFSVVNQTTGLTSTSQNANNVDLGVTLNYFFVPNRVVGQLTYDRLIYTTDSTSNDFLNPASDTYTTHDASNVVGVRFSYIF